VTGRIVASILTDRDVDDASQVEPLLDQIAEPVEVFLGDGGYDRTGVYTALDERHPAAKVIVPPRADAVLSATAATMKEPALRASSRAGSRSSAMDCVSTATKPVPPKLPSLPKSSTKCLTARTPSASPDHQRGMGAPLPLPSLCITLPSRVDFGQHPLSLDAPFAATARAALRFLLLSELVEGIITVTLSGKKVQDSFPRFTMIESHLVGSEYDVSNRGRDSP
jgi:hypothetical protein